MHHLTSIIVDELSFQSEARLTYCMMLRVGVVRPDRLYPWPDRSGQAPGLSGRPDRPAGLWQPCFQLLFMAAIS